MPSTRKQTPEKQSRHSDVMSDMENLGAFIGSYSRNEAESQLNENEEHTDRRSNKRQSNPLIHSNPSGDDFKSLRNTNSAGSSEI